jgi:GTP diphosphokinase / guanosine-3',5'-bis(diphosphate) 3'-diphosphatase
MNLISEAIAFAVQAHGDQVDKQGSPYIFHCLRVMLAVDHPFEQVVAVLHDVFEDTSATVDDLRLIGCNDGHIAALTALTRSNDEAYSDYIIRLSRNRSATIVKIADLQDNLNRIGGIPLADQERLRPRYQKVLRKLEAL